MNLRITLVIVVVALVAGCGATSGTKGSGNVISESRTVRGFSAVELAGDGEVEIEQNGTESLTITADDNLLSEIKSEVRGGRLILDEKNVSSTGPVRYKLSVKSLSEIGLSGDGRVDAKGVLTDRLKIGISGDGSIRTVGTAEQQEISISGDGKYEAQDLKSKTAQVSISGDGSAILAVSEKLDANISGDGSVEYTGDPTVSEKISGDGAVRKK